MSLSQSILGFLSKAMDFLSSIGSTFAPVVDPTKANASPTPTTTTNKEHQHHPHDPARARERSSWLESRGYEDSFARDDEVKPDPKEDALIFD
jgi:hypothetical protein